MFVSVLSRLKRQCAVVMVCGFLCLPLLFSFPFFALAAEVTGELASPHAPPDPPAAVAATATATTATAATALTAPVATAATVAPPASAANDPGNAAHNIATADPADLADLANSADLAEPAVSDKKRNGNTGQPRTPQAEPASSGMAANAAMGEPGGNAKIVSEDSTRGNADAPRADLLPQPLGAVAHCFDGDTFKLTDRRVVRLAGIDSPELSKGSVKAQFFAREAREQLNALAKGQQVQLLQAGVKHRDPHGRILAEVLLPDGTSLNETMVRNGAAYFYPHQDLSPQLQERLRSLQQEAITARRGMWAFLLSQPVAKNTYLGNKESLRFFPADCAEAQHIRPRNRVYFGNLMDAFMAGYAPARVCSFWPVAP